MIEQQIMIIGTLLVFSVIASVLSSKFKQPFVLGLLLVGLLIGPDMLNLVNDQTTIDLMIELGTILFLFVIGMEFSVKKLTKIGGKALIITLFKVAIMFFVGFIASVALGFSITTAAFLGVALSFSSTAIIVNMLKEKDMILRSEVPLLIAVLVIEDVLGIFALTFFKSLFKAGPLGVFAAAQQLVISLTVMIFIYVLVSRYADKIVKWITDYTGEDLIMFIGMTLCISFAYVGYLLGLSLSAGAFLAGSIISTLTESKKFEHSIKSQSMTFTTFFFIAIGTTIKLSSLSGNVWKIIILIGVISVAMFFAIGITGRIFANFSRDGVIFSTLAMLPPGVFSLLIAKEGANFGVEIDLVTIISIIILATSVVMSFALNYYHHVDLFSSKRRVIKPISRVSEFIRTLFEELEVENFHTRRLHNVIRQYISTSLIGLFVVVLITKLASVFHIKMIKYGFIILVCVSTVYWLRNISRLYKQIITQIVNILSNLEDGTKAQQTRRILEYTMLWLILSLAGLFSPLAIFAFNLSGYYLFACAGIIIVGQVFFIQASQLLGKVSYNHKFMIPTYKKFVPQFRREVA